MIGYAETVKTQQGRRKLTRSSKRETVSLVVSATDAKRRFADLLKPVQAGGTVTIAHHNKPVAKLVPIMHVRPRQFGFLKGLAKILDPEWDSKPTLTEEEIDKRGEARY
jgi:prevent-host-death family protein